MTLYAFKNYITRGQAWRKNKSDRPTLRPLFVFNMYYARQICLLAVCVNVCLDGLRCCCCCRALFLYLIKMQIRPLEYIRSPARSTGSEFSIMARRRGLRWRPIGPRGRRQHSGIRILAPNKTILQERRQRE